MFYTTIYIYNNYTLMDIYIYAYTLMQLARHFFLQYIKGCRSCLQFQPGWPLEHSISTRGYSFTKWVV